MKKHVFALTIPSAAAVSDTGLYPAFGSLDQVRWVPDAQDTGPAPSSATFAVWMQRAKGEDTGISQVVFSAAAVPGNDATWSVEDTGGHKFYLAGELLKVRATAADTGAAVAGKFYVYTSGNGDLL